MDTKPEKCDFPGMEHLPRLGVLLSNLGTPDAPDTAAVRRFLREFLSDPKVIRLPRWIWLPILHGLILRFRAPRTARAYRAVWTERGSPLAVHSERQRRALQIALDGRGGAPVSVVLGMRYGRPSIADALHALREAGVEELVVLPLYPQRSETTSGSTEQAVREALGQRGWEVLPRFVDDYHRHPGYLDALAESVHEYRAEKGRGERLLLSFHGLPKRYCEGGRDPYAAQCHATARELALRLDCRAEEWAIAFQSRVGRGEWLRPYTDETLTRWGRQGIGHVQVLCPGFAADCLETLEEIAIREAARFRAAGGRRLDYIPALNDRGSHIEALAELVLGPR